MGATLLSRFKTAALQKGLRILQSRAVGAFLFEAARARACGSKGQAAKLAGCVADCEEPDCG